MFDFSEYSFDRFEMVVVHQYSKKTIYQQIFYAYEWDDATKTVSAIIYNDGINDYPVRLMCSCAMI